MTGLPCEDRSTGDGMSHRCVSSRPALSRAAAVQKMRSYPVAPADRQTAFLGDGQAQSISPRRALGRVPYAPIDGKPNDGSIALEMETSCALTEQLQQPRVPVSGGIQRECRIKSPSVPAPPGTRGLTIRRLRQQGCAALDSGGVATFGQGDAEEAALNVCCIGDVVTHGPNQLVNRFRQFVCGRVSCSGTSVAPGLHISARTGYLSQLVDGSQRSPSGGASPVSA